MRNKKQYATLFLCFILATTLTAQNHDYPQIGIMHFGRVNEVPDWWYARFDYLETFILIC